MIVIRMTDHWLIGSLAVMLPISILFVQIRTAFDDDETVTDMQLAPYDDQFIDSKEQDKRSPQVSHYGEIS